MQLLSLRNALPIPLYSLDQGYMPGWEGGLLNSNLLDHSFVDHSPKL
jgi:hypothetical protein